jgi:hypothetical protein
MDQYQNMRLQDLVELLSDKTSLYARMLILGFTDEEFKECRQAMLELQVEIEARRRSSGVTTTIGDPDIFFKRTENT